MAEERQRGIEAAVVDVGRAEVAAGVAVVVGDPCVFSRDVADQEVLVAGHILLVVLRTHLHHTYLLCVRGKS